MDDSISTILYIVVAIGAFVISAIGKNKKRKDKIELQQRRENVSFVPTESDGVQEEKNVKSSNNKPENRGVNELFDEFFGIDEIEKQEDLIKQDENIKSEDKLNIKPEENPDIKKDVNLKTDNRESVNENIDENDDEYDDETHILDTFDLENAVIYSEILSRQEY